MSAVKSKGPWSFVSVFFSRLTWAEWDERTTRGWKFTSKYLCEAADPGYRESKPQPASLTPSKTVRRRKYVNLTTFSILIWTRDDLSPLAGWDLIEKQELIIFRNEITNNFHLPGRLWGWYRARYSQLATSRRRKTSKANNNKLETENFSSSLCGIETEATRSNSIRKFKFTLRCEIKYSFTVLIPSSTAGNGEFPGSKFCVQLRAIHVGRSEWWRWWVDWVVLCAVDV